MITISDVIDAKNSVLARYQAPEYLNSELARGNGPAAQRRAQLDREIILNELLIYLIGLELVRETPTSPVNAKE